MPVSESTAGDSSDGANSAELRLRPPRNQLNKRAVRWWLVQTVLLVGVPVVVLIVLGLLLPDARTVLWLCGGGLAVAGLPLAILLPFWWYRVHRWEVTESAVYTRTGFFWQEWRAVPMSRIQTVDTQRGPLEQFFGLATVIVTTASAKGAVQIQGLDHELAGDLAQQLTETTQATPGDAT